jgi:hypothetical protein
MLRLRRLYFYLVLYLSLAMVLTGLATVLRVLLEQALGAASSGISFGLFAGRDQFREQTAFGVALVLIGLPVWLLHWRAVGGWLTGADQQDERASALRRLYLYAVLLTTALTAYVAARDLLEHLLGLPLGLASGSEQLVGIARSLPYLLMAGLFWAYHWRLAAADRALVGESGASATLRRWYVYLMLVAGVVPLMVNLASLLQQLWVILLDRPGLAAVGAAASARTVAASSATALVALGVWLLHRNWSEAAVAHQTWYGEREPQSVLCKVCLYGLVLGTVSWVLFNASQVLRFGFLTVLSVAPQAVGGAPVLVALGAPLAKLVVFGAFWAYYWRAVNQEAATAGEAGRQASVRRVYFYFVSLAALALLAHSLAGLLGLLAEALVQGQLVDPEALRRSLATYGSGLLIALPVWLFHWSRIQRLVAGPRSEEETRATSRRWYLYVVIFAAVIVLLTSGARIVYELTLTALGRPWDEVVALHVARLAIDGAVAAALLWYHWWLVLRADLAARRPTARATVGVAIIAGLDADTAEALARFARESLPGSRVELYWTDEAHVRELVSRAAGRDGP